MICEKQVAGQLHQRHEAKALITTSRGLRLSLLKWIVQLFQQCDENGLTSRMTKATG